MRRALTVCMSIAVAIAILCRVAAWWYPIGEATPDDMATLNTLAQVAAGAFATLVTVVVFAIGLIAQRGDGASTYMPFAARRFHVFVVAALAAAVSLVNALGPIVGEYTGLSAIKYLLLINLIAMPVVVLTTLWLMCRVIEAASGADLVATLPVFRSAMLRIAQHDQLQAAIASEFLACLEDSPVKFNRWAGLDTTLAGRPCGAGVEKLVIDVDLYSLRQIVELCRPYGDSLEFSVLSAPTLTGDRRGIIYSELRRAKRILLMPGEDNGLGEIAAGTREKTTTLESMFGQDRLTRLSELADRLLIYGERPDTDADLRQFFTRTQFDLLRLARAGESVSLKARLEDYRKLLQVWLSVAGPSISPLQSRHFAHREPKFLGPLEIDLADILRAAVQSDDFQTYEAVVDGVTALFYDADTHKAVTLYADATRLLAFAFYLAMQKPEFRASAQPMFDGRVHSLFRVSKGARNSDEDTEETDDGIDHSSRRGMRYSIFGSVLSMIRYAIEAGEVQTAKMLFDRLTREIAESRRSGRLGETAPAGDNGDSLVQYSVIVVVGWCQHMVRENHAEKVAARVVMDHALSSVPPPHLLIGLWEVFHGNANRKAEVDEELLVSHWDVHQSERRVGIAYTTSGGSPWITDGLWVAMLKASSPNVHELDHFVRVPPNRWMWKTEGLDARLTQLQTSLLLNGTPEELKAARVSVIKLVQQRQRTADVISLMAIAQTPISVERQDRFRNEILNSVVKQRKWPKILAPNLEAVRTATKVHEPTQIITNVKRDYLCDISNWSSGYGELIAEDMVHRESQRLIYEVEQSLPFADMPFSLASMDEAVRSAVQELAGGGFKADLLIVPPNDRFAYALFRRPLWDQSIGRCAEWGSASVGIWEGLTVVRCPYPNTSSVVVADSRILFGRVEKYDAQPTVQMTDASEEAKQAFLAKVTERGAEPLPDDGELRVATLVTLPPVLGIANINAACRINVTNGTACFAMQPDDSLYHRADCGELEGAEDLMLLLSKRLDGESNDRTPCSVCKPERWDHEAKLIAREST